MTKKIGYYTTGTVRCAYTQCVYMFSSVMFDLVASYMSTPKVQHDSVLYSARRSAKATLCNAQSLNHACLSQAKDAIVSLHHALTWDLTRRS